MVNMTDSEFAIVKAILKVVSDKCNYYWQNENDIDYDKKEYENKLVFLMGVEKARFRNPVVPDCKLLLKIEAIRSHGRVWKYKGEAFVDDKKMADAMWSATIVDKK